MSETTGLEIAVIGMAGRFPGAPDVASFWHNICTGVEAVTRFSAEQLRARGVAEATLADPSFVPVGVLLAGMDEFDAGLFDYSAREAAYLDPQQRLFLECAWQALEHAGYLCPLGTPAPLIGVYAGAGANLYLLRQVLPTVGASSDVADLLALSNGSSSGSLCTRVAYKLNLRGPALSVQTECSTSLVAVHLACNALLSHECDVALAGGVWLNLLQELGYRHQSGAILASDGHCRAFDAQADGTLIGSGVGTVVLKRLHEAVRDGDTIHAVIVGSAINNDGADKIGFTAPSVSGQAAVIRAALAMAGVSAESIGYIEAHGTGTQLGDPIELAALTEVFGAGKSRSCAVGSVKTNIGHLDAAAGVAGLIKTVLALEHATLPASLNFQTANPHIDFAAGPFYVNTTTRAWPAGRGPRRAAVSSFGIGGTNAHVVLEAAPLQEPSRDTGVHVLRLAARSAAALAAQARQLADHLEQHAELPLSAADYTLRVGRRRFAWRTAAVGSTRVELIRALRESGSAQCFCAQASPAPSIGWLFVSGPVNLDLLQHPWLHQAVQQCERAHASAAQRAPWFVIQYALAQLWLSWKVTPDTLLGQGGAVYLAACIAGVMPLELALRLTLDASAQIDTSQLRAPHIALVVDAGGAGLTEAQALQPSFWAQQASVEVPSDVLLARPERLVLALGGQSASLNDERYVALPLDTTDLELQLSCCLARLWVAGIEAQTTPSGRRVPLPTYPFERQSYWLGATGHHTPRDLTQWGYQPVWRRLTSIPSPSRAGCTLVLGSVDDFTQRLVLQLRESGVRVVLARPGAQLAARGVDEYELRPTARADYSMLLEQLSEPVTHVCHLLSLGTLADELDAGFFSLLAVAQALAGRATPHITLTVVSDAVEDVSGMDRLQPRKAALHGVCRVLPLEHGNITCRLIDIIGHSQRSLALLTACIYDTRALPLIAVRGAQAWVKEYQPLALEPGAPRLRQQGVYIITGGLGGMALALARHLTQQWQARVVLLPRRVDPQARELQAANAQVLVLPADVTDIAAVRSALHTARTHFGSVHGVIHAAGVAGGGLLAGRSRDACAAVLAPKVAGSEVLLQALAGESLDFIMLCSSLTALSGDVGQVDYCAANCVLDALATQAQQRSSTWVISVNWDAWRATGMTRRLELGDAGMTVEQGIAVFERLLASEPVGQVAVSALELQQQWSRAARGVSLAAASEQPVARARHPRPPLQSAYVAPAAGLQQSLAALWSEFLGIAPIGANDNLFELGGDSLLALQLLARVRSNYGIELPPAQLLHQPTIAVLAELIELRLIEDIEQQSNEPLVCAAGSSR